MARDDGAGLLLWAVAWLVAEAIVYAFRLLAKIADALEVVLQRLIDAVMGTPQLEEAAR